MLLVVCHSRSGSTAALRDAVLEGVADAGASARSLDVAEAHLSDVVGASALLVCTPARFGALAGLTKDLFERIYPWFEDVPMVRPGLPYALVVRGGSDADGAVRDVHRIATGLRWREVLPPVMAVGPEVTADHMAAAREQGATMAAGIDEGIF